MTNDMFSSDIAVTLRQRATLVDPAAAQRITAHVADTRPQSRRLAVAGSAAGTAGVGAIVAAVVTLSGATPAFAGWTPSPSVARPRTPARRLQPARTSSHRCQAGRGRHWTPTATDVRGPYVLESVVSGSMSATCLTGPSVTSVSFADGGSLSSSRAGSGGDPGGASSTTNYAHGGAVRELTLSSLNTGSGAPFDTVEGAVAADVTAISFELSDGQSIKTTVSDGLVLAWWPSGSKPVSAQVTTASGTTHRHSGRSALGRGRLFTATAYTERTDRYTSPSVRRKGAQRAVLEQDNRPLDSDSRRSRRKTRVEVFVVPFGWYKATAYFATRSSLICRFNAI